MYLAAMRPPTMVVVVVVLLVTAAEAGHAPALVLERALPLKGVLLEHIRELDRARHTRMILEGTVNPLVNGGTGLYYVTVKLGNPSKKHTFQIDTGSGISWVACKGCLDVSTKSVVNISTELYSPGSSSTSSKISCLDDSCAAAAETESSICQTPLSLCDYNITYGDETWVSGYYVSDTMYFDTFMGNQRSASVVFGVVILDNVNHLHTETAKQVPINLHHLYIELAPPMMDLIATKCCPESSRCTTSLSHFSGVDGILGFAQNQLSIIPQLHSGGVSPKMFSHCLKGSEKGGGILVLGKIVEPRLVFTPLVSSKYHYTLNLESIAVNGQKLPIDSSLFASSHTHGTIVDTGAILAYLVDGAYQPLVSAVSSWDQITNSRFILLLNSQYVTNISAEISPSVGTLNSKWNGKWDRCFQSSSRIDLLFPTVTLYFEGGAAMTVEPLQYLLQQGTVGNDFVWCMAWQSSQALPKIIQGITVLGNIVLHDKLVVYDLEKARLGWTNYNCSSLNMNSSFEVSGASPYYIGLLAIGVAVIFLGALLMD